jgi:hypothetical protein
MYRISLFIILFFFSAKANAQNLSFLGLSNIQFGMSESSLKDKILVPDSTSAYTDTAVYLKTTNCHVYYCPHEKLELSGFRAARIEYEFCGGKLAYVFIRVNSSSEIEKALSVFQREFKNLSCGKKTPLNTCTLLDAKHKKLRTIISMNQYSQEMNIVLIAR